MVTCSKLLDRKNRFGSRIYQEFVTGVSVLDFTQRADAESPHAANDQPMNMLGVIQSQKTAELLLDLRVDSIVCSSKAASIETAGVISQDV
ncbi:unnamed protein product [Microthlaspi erraticum]|uniref:Uncharacterized protein n=1 Tax=Microthlaspi erraticum TaxID=1685480 RepID=A0A6D2L657_9BRAS|nr:unnamed protein product [Microthlaspi erraticum]